MKTNGKITGKTGVFYGSSTGYTADVANRIAKALGVEMKDVYDVANTEPSKVGDYDTIVMGCSTWGAGDMQDSMVDFTDGMQAMYLGDKKIALFGVGDENMSDTFCNAVGRMYEKLQPTKAEFIGEFNADGYDFNESMAKIGDGVYAGLLIDEVNHADMTDDRIAKWVESIS